ncbi:hypothetical protein WK78_26425 [Burkholderia cepacia]|uniref:hypothetical protein n=1 Tax=Burkholderia cepacia TaxID=292 RepID=UPI00075BC9D4|nr:hypothetical protein [Burkholderia cepacia]KVV20848.1 hypothetical protein WK78_26425 [Burkholderia cepacia]
MTGIEKESERFDFTKKNLAQATPKIDPCYKFIEEQRQLLLICTFTAVGVYFFIMAFLKLVGYQGM